MNFEGYSDASLVALMAEQVDEPEIAKDALGTLFERHAEFLTPVVSGVYGSLLGGAAAAEDMVVEVFWRAFEHCGRAGAKGKAGDFETKFHGEDPERSRMLVRAWLSRIAKNMFIDELRQAATADEQQLDDQLFRSLAEPDSAHILSPKLVQMVHKALDVLTSAERDALTACLNWYDPVTGKFDMGNDAPEVARSLGKTVGSIKKARRRALDRLRALDLPVSLATSTE